MEHIYLRNQHASLLIGVPGGEASVLHWGADLGPELPALEILAPPIPHSALDVPVVHGLLPQPSSGWPGRPGLRGHRPGVADSGFSPRLRVLETSVGSNPAGTAAGGTGPASARIRQGDDDAGLEVCTDLTLHPGGLLELRHTLSNTGTTAYQLDELAAALPVGPEGREILDLTGRWCRERHPQRHGVQQGTWLRSGRHGRTGHDSTLLLAVGSAGFGNRHGKVWAAHLGWSGDHESYVDSLADGRTVLGAAELLGSGELVLAPGESYGTPSLFTSYSDRGLDGISEAFYAWFRARGNHPATPRPVVLNTWEAVYFNHDLPTLTELAAAAAQLGVERFVLDDGWFRSRRNDSAGLGDWYVDEDLWPQGLHPLINEVTGRGMEFGLWVEPEMVNADSDLARNHPDWISSAAVPQSRVDRRPLEWRHQQVLDLVNPDAWQYIYGRLDALLREHSISYLKWDQNRDLREAGHLGRPSVHAQTLAAYRLFDALRSAHPGVEIESCSSGGARVDLGILQRTDRVWASDCNDALERQTIQRWTSLVVPPELVGSHIGPPTAHTTGRTHELPFRATTALFGHFGLEWDIRPLAGAEREDLSSFIELYKRFRGLIHSGVMVHADVPDPALALHGSIAADRSEAIFALAALETSAAEQPGRIGIPGLDPQRLYRVNVLWPTPGREGHTYLQTAPPPWLAEGAVASGRFLAQAGLPMPVLNPEQALLLHLAAVRA